MADPTTVIVVTWSRKSKVYSAGTYTPGDTSLTTSKYTSRELASSAISKLEELNLTKISAKAIVDKMEDSDSRDKIENSDRRQDGGQCS